MLKSMRLDKWFTLQASLENDVASLGENVRTLTEELDTSVKTRQSLEDQLMSASDTWNKKVSSHV